MAPELFLETQMARTSLLALLWHVCTRSGAVDMHMPLLHPKLDSFPWAAARPAYSAYAFYPSARHLFAANFLDMDGYSVSLPFDLRVRRAALRCLRSATPSPSLTTSSFTVHAFTARERSHCKFSLTFSLAFSLQVTLARFLARQPQLMVAAGGTLRCFNASHSYRRHKRLQGIHPRESHDCTFDVVRMPAVASGAHGDTSAAPASTHISYAVSRRFRVTLLQVRVC